MPINPNELKKRKWPLPSVPIGPEIIGRKKTEGEIVFYEESGKETIVKEGGKYADLPYPDDYLESCYVRKDKVAAIPLPILPGECGITSLAKDSEGKIFGSTCGNRCHLFMYNPDGIAKTIVDLGTVEENCEKSSLVISTDGCLFLGTKPVSGDGHIYSYPLTQPSPPRGEESKEGKNKISSPHGGEKQSLLLTGSGGKEISCSGKIEKICCPVKGEGISALTIDNNSSRIYGLSSRSGTFFIFHPEKGSVELKGAVDKEGLFSETLIVTSNGDVFGGSQWTELFKYEVKKESLIPLKIKAPSICGREMYNRIESLIWDEKTQSIYGGTSADGILFRYHTKEEKMISLGKPLTQPHIRCLTMGVDNCIYGIAGKNCCHLFKYNHEEGDLRDLGILYVSSPRYWHGYEFDSAITGKNGEIYFGESDRISHLFIYLPEEKVH